MCVVGRQHDAIHGGTGVALKVIMTLSTYKQIVMARTYSSLSL